MFDPFEPNNFRKDQPQTLDYRNAKYHGYIDQQKQGRQGLGILLDHNYLFAIGKWKKGKLQGSSFILYPDDSIFYGTVTDKLPVGICTYIGPDNSYIYGSLNSQGDSIFILDQLFVNTLQLVLVRQNLYQKLIENDDIDQNFLAEQSRKKNSQDIIVMRQKTYKDNDEKLQIISKIFKQNIPDYLYQYSKYINKKIKEKDNNLELIQGRQDCMIKFKKSSVICKLQNINKQIKTKLLGYYNQSLDSMEISKREMNNQIQETMGSQCVTYAYGDSQRPSQCMAALHHYYKQSLTFVNQYLPIDYLYRIKFIFHSVSQLFNKVSINPHAQSLLQNSRVSESKASRQKSNQRNQLVNSRVTPLQVVKNDIYRAVRKKSLSNSSIRKSYNRSPEIVDKNDQVFSRLFKNTNPFAYYLPKTSTPQKYIPKNKSSLTLKPTNTIYSAPPQKIKIIQKKQQPSTQPIHYDRYTNKYSNNSPLLSKYAYLDQIGQIYSSKRATNLKNLTQQYEDIQSQLKKQRYYKEITRDIYVSPYNFKGSRDGYNVNNQHERLLGSRKIMHYGWE